MREFTVYDIFEKNALIQASADAVVFGNRRLTFEHLHTRASSLAAGLKREGIGRGDRIALLALNTDEFFTLFGAAASSGAILVPLNWRLSLDELAYILQDCTPSALFFDTRHRDTVGELIRRDLPVGKTVCIDSGCEGTPSLEQMITSPRTDPTPVNQDDPFCIIYTAAVAGKPRGAVLSHGNIIFGNMQTIATMGLTRRDACLDMLPLFHITGLNLALATMHAGGKNVVTEKFDALQALALTETERISLFGSFAPILSRLLAEMETGTYDVSTWRNVTGIEPVDIIQSFEKTTSATFWPLYGQSETSGTVTLCPASERPGSAGRPGLLAVIALADEHDRILSKGDTGEIVVRGPLVFNGYWNQEEVNRYTFRNGWHHTGDLGKFDNDGYLWFAGRKPEKELIKPGGENVYPAEVEDVIRQHPDIVEVSVIGVADPEFGEGIKAVCVRKGGSSLEARELIAFVAGRIARYKKPKYVQFVSSLPKTATGSIDRASVKSLYGKP